MTSTSTVPAPPAGAAPPAGPAAAAPRLRPAPPHRSLSPSRAGDFLACPLLYRFRTVDRLPEPPSSAATRGTVVHAVLERLFDLPAVRRTPEEAAALLEPEWERLVAQDPEQAALFGDDAAALARWLASARGLLGAYFSLEDPRRLEPGAREERVEVELDSGLRLRGVLDRLDVAPDGRTRVVDYKTGRAPGVGFEARAMFQMRFYALVLWRSTGRVPTVLQLMYLGDREVLRYSPTESDLLACERKLEAVWAAVDRALGSGDFRPRRGPLCGWCSHQALCPEFGGTPPPYPGRPPAALGVEVAAGDGPGSSVPGADQG